MRAFALQFMASPLIALALLGLVDVRSSEAADDVDSMEVSAPEKTLVGHEKPVRLMKMWDEGKRLVSAAEDGTIIAWDTIEGRALHTWKTDPAAKIVQLAVSSNGARIATGDEAGVVRVWDVASGEKVYESPKQAAAVTALAINRQGDQFAAVLADETVRCFAPPAEPKSFPADPRGHSPKSSRVAICFNPTSTGVLIFRSLGAPDEYLFADWNPKVPPGALATDKMIPQVWLDSTGDRLLYGSAGQMYLFPLAGDAMDTTETIRTVLPDLRDAIPVARSGHLLGTVQLNPTHHLVLGLTDPNAKDLRGLALTQRRNPARAPTALALLDAARFAAGRRDGAIDVWNVQARRPNSHYWFHEYRPKLNALLDAEKYEEIEAIVARYRASRERFPEGWRITCGVYDVLSSAPRGVDARVAQLKAWIEKHPKSLLPRVALGQLYKDWGWNARGTGLAFSVSEENFRLFHERLTLARDALNEAVTLNVPSSQLSRVLINVAIGLGAPPDEVRRLFHEGLKDDPQDLQLFEQATLFFFPRWHGEPGDCADLLDSGVAGLPPDDAAEIYSRIVWFVMKYEGQKLVHLGGFDEEMLKRGARVMLKRYPDEQRLQQQSLLWAYFSEDLENAKRLLPHVGAVGNVAVFGSEGFWDRVVRWAKEPPTGAKKIVKLQDAFATHACVADGGKLIVTAGGKRNFEGSVFTTWSAEHGFAYSVALSLKLRQLVGSPKGALVAFVARDDQDPEKSRVGVIDLATHEPIAAIDEPSPECKLSFSPDGQLLLMTSPKAACRVYDLRDPTAQPHEFDLGKPDALAVFAPTGDQLIAIWPNGLIRAIDLKTGETVKEHQRVLTNNVLLAPTLSSDGRRLLIGGTAAAEVWDAEKVEQVARLHSGRPWLLGNAVSNDGALVATVEDNRTPQAPFNKTPIAVRRTANPGGSRLYTPYDDTVRLLHFSPDGTTLHCVDGEGRLYVWDVRDQLPKPPADAKPAPAKEAGEMPPQ